jgi:hypothetical protein
MEQLPDTKTMTIQLLGKDDSRIDDSEMLAERWQAYVDSFVSVRVLWCRVLWHWLMCFVLCRVPSQRVYRSPALDVHFFASAYMLLFTFPSRTNVDTCFAGMSLPQLLLVPQRCSHVVL